MALKIGHVAAEYAGLAQAGGLGDVVAALGKEFAQRGHDVRAFLPLYGGLNADALPLRPLPEVQEVAVPLGGVTSAFSACSLRVEGTEAELILVDCPQLYGGKGIYSGGGDEAVRFSLLARATLETCQRLGWSPDVLHCHDWHAALVPAYLKTEYAWDETIRGAATLLTIHNMAYQGIFSDDVVPRLGFQRPGHALAPAGTGQVNFLRTGIEQADLLSTVSPTYAREIQGPVRGEGLHEVLRRRSGDLVGILNGVDYETWSPESDALIPQTYSTGDLTGKRVCRDRLLQRLELRADPAGPVFGVVSRLVGQKGLDLVPAAMEKALQEHDARLAVLGTGDDAIERAFATLREKQPDRVGYVNDFDVRLAHWIEAGADVFLMPSRFEPCGLNQMYSLRYGTVPVVYRTGGLADTVKPFDAGSGTGTGFVFEHHDLAGLTWAVGEAVKVFASRELWRRLQASGMQQDFSWSLQAEHYLELYNRLAARKTF